MILEKTGEKVLFSWPSHRGKISVVALLEPVLGGPGKHCPTLLVSEVVLSVFVELTAHGIKGPLSWPL